MLCPARGGRFRCALASRGADFDGAAFRPRRKDKEEEEKVEENSNDSSANYGYLGWLHKLIDLSKVENSDIFPDKKINVDQMHEG